MTDVAAALNGPRDRRFRIDMLSIYRQIGD